MQMEVLLPRSNNKLRVSSWYFSICCTHMIVKILERERFISVIEYWDDLPQYYSWILLSPFYGRSHRFQLSSKTVIVSVVKIVELSLELIRLLSWGSKRIRYLRNIPSRQEPHRVWCWVFISRTSFFSFSLARPDRLRHFSLWSRKAFRTLRHWFNVTSWTSLPRGVVHCQIMAEYDK